MLPTLIKTTFDSNEGGIKMSSPGSTKFKDKLWSDKELEEKRKLNYYKEVINPTLANQNYLFVLTNGNKRMNIARIRT